MMMMMMMGVDDGLLRETTTRITTLHDYLHISLDLDGWMDGWTGGGDHPICTGIREMCHIQLSSNRSLHPHTQCHRSKRETILKLQLFPWSYTWSIWSIIIGVVGEEGSGWSVLEGCGWSTSSNKYCGLDGTFFAFACLHTPRPPSLTIYRFCTTHTHTQRYYCNYRWTVCSLDMDHLESSLNLFFLEVLGNERRSVWWLE
jgi:hypothetical protein